MVNQLALPKDTVLNNGRYKIVKEINRGATAIVYEAEDRDASRVVALKVINAPEQVPVEVAKREIDVSTHLRHENMVRMLDVFAEGSQLVLVWELVSGPDLLDLLNECGGRMAEDMASFYFMQLVKALLFMHKNGFCHRDVKPENSIVERDTCRLKLIDFGLSKHLESARTLGVGTPDYMSPELLQQMGAAKGRGAARYDAKGVDAWAMGVMLYLLVSGKYPFEDPAHPNSLIHTINNIRKARMQPLPVGTSSECTQLIFSLLQPNPTVRAHLDDVVNNTWLVKQACQYAQSIGHEDYVVDDSTDHMDEDLMEVTDQAGHQALPLVSTEKVQAVLERASMSATHAASPQQVTHRNIAKRKMSAGGRSSTSQDSAKSSSSRAMSPKPLSPGSWFWSCFRGGMTAE